MQRSYGSCYLKEARSVQGRERQSEMGSSGCRGLDSWSSGPLTRPSTGMMGRVLALLWPNC